MNAGDLGVRVDDLEKANESVAVRLSKLRRGGSVKSTASSFNSDPDDFKPKRKNPAKTLFQNRCIQMILLALVAAIAISLGAKYLLFFSSRSLKTREKYISFVQFLYFLREVCLFFNVCMIRFTIMSKTKQNCEYYHSKIET